MYAKQLHFSMFFWLLRLELKTSPPKVCLDLLPALLQNIVKGYYAVFIDNLEKHYKLPTAIYYVNIIFYFVLLNPFNNKNYSPKQSKL